MRIATKPISHYRLQRFHRWAMLWLSWFAAFLEAAADFGPLSKQAHAIGHRWLDRIERLIVCIIIMRVTPYVRGINKRKGPNPHRRIETSLFRAIVGGHMRRVLRSKHLHQRIAALRLNIDSLVARVLRRLPCGLTRRRPILARPEQRSADADGVCSTPTVCADTS